MKVTMLTKRISTNVIAATADAALTLLFTQDECKDFSVLNAQVSVIAAPDAVRKTFEFAEQSGLYVIGHYPGLIAGPELHVWSVTVDLEYAVDFTIPQMPPAPADTSGQGLPQEGLQSADAGSQGTLVKDVWEKPEGSGQWYHRDEAEQAHGPFPGRAEAYQALRDYVKQLNDGPVSNESGQEAAPDLSSELKPE